MKRCTEWRGKHAAVVDNHVNYIDKLARYEDLDEKGLLLQLPAPLGSTVYSVHDRCRAPYWDCPFMGGFGMSRCGTTGHCESYYEPTELCLGDLNYIGVTIFLTEEEAKESVERNNAK